MKRTIIGYKKRSLVSKRTATEHKKRRLPLSYSSEFMILFHTHMNAIFHVLQELNFNSMAVDAPTYWSFSSVHHTNMAVVWNSDVTVRHASSMQLLQLWCGRRSLTAKYVSRSVLWKISINKTVERNKRLRRLKAVTNVAFVRRHLPPVGSVGRLTRAYQMQQLQWSGPCVSQPKGFSSAGHC